MRAEGYNKSDVSVISRMQYTLDYYRLTMKSRSSTVHSLNVAGQGQKRFNIKSINDSLFCRFVRTEEKAFSYTVNWQSNAF